MNEQEIKAQLKQELKEEMKKSKRKKIIIFIIILIIAVGVFFAIRQSRISRTSPTEQSKMKIMTEEEFAQYTTEIPITTENWKNYVDIQDVEEEVKNNLQEVERTNKLTKISLKNENIYGCIVLKLKIINADTTDNEQIATLYNGNDVQAGMSMIRDKNEDEKIYDTRVGIDNIQCIQATGILYKVEIPEDIWQIDENGKEYFMISNGSIQGHSGYNIYYKDNYLQILGYKEYNKLQEQKNAES